MKRTLVTLLSITRLCLPLGSVSFSSSFILFISLTHWHVVMGSHWEWWLLNRKYRLFITISTGQAGTLLKSWTLWVSITPAETKPKLLRPFNTISTDMYWISPDTSSESYFSLPSSLPLAFLCPLHIQGDRRRNNSMPHGHSSLRIWSDHHALSD